MATKRNPRQPTLSCTALFHGSGHLVDFIHVNGSGHMGG